MNALSAFSPAASEPSDEEVVERVRSGDVAIFELLMRRYNQRIYRVARAILRDDSEAEDVMQEAYVRAYEHLDQFAGRAKFSTWLTRIAVNESIARLQRRTRIAPLHDNEEEESRGDPMERVLSPSPSPEQQTASRELGYVLERAVMSLPVQYRTVLMMRDVEEMTTAETAHALDLTEENVKVRLHRARALLRKELYAQTGHATAAAFQFHALRCDRVVKRVFERIARANVPLQ